MESPIAQRRCQTETTGKRGLRSCPTEPPVVSAQNLRSDLTTAAWFRRLAWDVPPRRDRPHARRRYVGRFWSPAFVAAAPVDGLELGGFDRGWRRSGNTATAVGEVKASGNRSSTGSRANCCSRNPPRSGPPPRRASVRPSASPAIRARDHWNFVRWSAGLASYSRGGAISEKPVRRWRRSAARSPRAPRLRICGRRRRFSRHCEVIRPGRQSRRQE